MNKPSDWWSVIFIIIAFSVILNVSDNRIKDAKCEGRYGISEHKTSNQKNGTEILYCLTNRSPKIWEKY